MDIQAITDSVYYSYVILPILIFFARIFDQSIGILRIIVATKGLKHVAFIAGFFESLVWLLAISQILKEVDNIVGYIAFAAGFATGNFVGIYLEQRISIGFVVVRVVFRKNSDETIRLLRETNFTITIVDALGSEGAVKMIFSSIKRRELNTFISILNKNNPTAYYTVEDAKLIKDGVITKRKPFLRKTSVRK